MTKFKTKADTLKYLEKVLKNGKILPQFSFTIARWIAAENDINNIWLNRPKWSFKKLIVRSSSVNEDGKNDSKAGKFLSIKNVFGDKNIVKHRVLFFFQFVKARTPPKSAQTRIKSV